ncbi:MAG: M1 family metallopeptidase [Clostridia bacterium]|nr:M1 family metallopeptidase [Clostridia bacterium]
MKKILGVMLAILCSVTSIFPLTSCQKTQKPNTRYEITCEYVPENRTVTGTVKVTFKNPTDRVLELLKFQLYPNAYRKGALFSPISPVYTDSAYYAGESFGEMVISSVHGSKNWEIMGEDENILYVYLERSLFPDESVVLDIGFMTKLAQVNHRTGETERAVNLGNFFPTLCAIRGNAFVETVYYPIGNPFLFEVSDYKVTLTLPKEYTVASTGNFLEERMLESKKVHTMYAMNARDFAMVLSDNAQKLSAKSGNTELVYCYYADTTPQETLALIQECFAFYEKVFGKYPYDVYTVAETGFCKEGATYPGLLMLSDRLQNEEKTWSIAKQTAHQWWRCVVGSDTLENAWQDEGMGAYSALLFFEEYEKYGFAREEIIKQALEEYRSYFDVYGSVLGRTDTRMTRSLGEYISEFEYRCLSHDKALLLLDTLRKSVGEEKFLQALRRYYAEQTFKVASVGDMVASFEKTGMDVSGLFDSFLQGKGVL